MTYTTGGLIQASDYNGFAANNSGANANGVWGVGSANAGYGQSTTLATVATGGTVTATQWASLNNLISTMASHQGTTITSRSNPTAGQTISILSNLNTDLTNITNNRGNAVAQGTQFTGWTGTASKTASTGSGTSAWSITFTDTITWSSANAARYFFNAGGLIKWQVSKTSTGQVADTEWNNMANTECGTIYISGGGTSQTIASTVYTGTTKVGGTGTPTVLTTGSGWYSFNTSPLTIYQQYSTGGTPYTGQYIAITAATASAGTQLVLTTTWVDPGGGTASSQISGGTATSGIVFGTAPSTVVTYIPPSSTYLTQASWGTPTVVSSVV
jgi:hypothetical protein